jgi:preprotein translocase subunit SecG
MISALVVFYFLVAFCLIVLVLLQDPKGNGAIFGGGGSQSLFGATGATSFIVKATRLVAILFAVSVIGINYLLMSESSKSAIYNETQGLSVPVLETEKTDEAPVDVGTPNESSTENPNETEQKDSSAENN